MTGQDSTGRLLPISRTLGGDLSGFTESGCADIETSVAPKIGQVDVYKVHHHGSQHSTNTAWPQTIMPR